MRSLRLGTSHTAVLSVQTPSSLDSEVHAFEFVVHKTVTQLAGDFLWFCRHAINMLYFDGHLAHLRSSVFWGKFGRLLVYDTDDNMRAALTRLEERVHLTSPPLLSLQGGCYRCALSPSLFLSLHNSQSGSLSKASANHRIPNKCDCLLCCPYFIRYRLLVAQQQQVLCNQHGHTCIPNRHIRLSSQNNRCIAMSAVL